jgi:hypothetical protein
MIEVVSWPKLSDEWDDENTPYFELYGETAPLVDMNYAQVLLVGPADGSPENTAEVPIYEYWWTIGHSGARYLAKNWSQLRDPAATISLYFPIDKGWRIKECAATVKYLSPVHEQEHWWSKAAEGWKHAAPLLNDMSSIANLIPIPALKGATSTLAAIAKLQINSVPQVEGFEWSVSKITHKRAKTPGYMQGIKWTLPKKMLLELGDRLTGSVAVSFISSQIQQAGTTPDGNQSPEFAPGAILARTEIHLQNQKTPIYVPSLDENPSDNEEHSEKAYISLQIKPRAPGG